MKAQNDWHRDGDRVVGFLIREIRHAGTWKHLCDAADAIFHVRHKQVLMEEESVSFAVSNGDSFLVSNWVPSRAESQGGGSSIGGSSIPGGSEERPR